MNSFDAEMHVTRQKEMARRAAENYAALAHQPQTGPRLVYKRALAGLGSRMITLGYRLQGEFEQLSTAPALADSLGLSPNNPCPEN
jgi:hypothetical protein